MAKEVQEFGHRPSRGAGAKSTGFVEGPAYGYQLLAKFKALGAIKELLEYCLSNPG
ncbi:MAG: hypothetical protein IMZ46_00050 [Acidobacteria bacterium]|nr:hypothetical protein [Acidobacteriota bacterium]